MAFNTVGIQDNLPVLPLHVLQIIQSLTFTGTYSAEDFFREGRTNFGAGAFTSSAHVEMHSLGGADPLVIYSGPFNDTEVFSVNVNGDTTATSIIATDAVITTLAVADEAVINSAITTAAISTANIQTATVSALAAQNAVITGLNGTVGAIADFTASNARVTNTATINTANITTANVTTDNVATAYIATGYIDNIVSLAAGITALTASNARVGNNLDVTNNVSIANDLTVTGDTTMTGDLAVTGSLASGQATVNYQNTDYVNTNGNNSHIKLNNIDPIGQTAISYVIDGKLRGKLRNDYVGNMNYISSGSGNHYFFTQGDAPGGNIRLMVSSSGNIGIGTTSPTTKLEVVGTTKATQFEGPLQGTASWALNVVNGGVAGNPAGVNGQVQYNNNGAFGAIPNITYLNGALSATGSFSGSLVGTATTASFVALQGQGITVNGTQLTASVRTVNGQFPTNGNIQASLTATKTGISASLVSSGSGAVTASLADGLVWVISNDPTPANNGKVYIYASSSVGQWYPVSPLDTAQGDARYLKLDGSSPMVGSINMSGQDITNIGGITVNSMATVNDLVVGGGGNTGQFLSNNLTGAKLYELPDGNGTIAMGVTSSLGSTLADINGNIPVETVPTASFVTGSKVFGPYGANSVVSSSFAVSASWAPVQTVSTASFITTGSIAVTQRITGSLRVTGSLGVTGSVGITDSVVAGNVVGGWKIGSTLNTIYNDTSEIAAFPYLHTYYNNAGSSGGGGVNFYYHDSALGYAYNGDNGDVAPMMYFIKDYASFAPNVRINTIISDNATTTVNTLNGFQPGGGNVRLYTYNGRNHVLTVTGSMLARDGVSLGTNIANSHIITGSVNMTGSFTLNGTNLSTLASPIQSVTVNITQNQILTLGSSPVTLLAAPGIGKVYDIVSVIVIYDYVSAAYTTATNIRFFHGGQSTYDTTNNFLATTGDAYRKISTDTYGGGLSTFNNGAITLSTTTGANPSGGDGTLKVTLAYQILNV